MTVAFMIGHVIEIAAVLLVTVPAALDIKRAGASRPLVGDLTATELVASEEAYLGPRVRALMVRLERRDLSTEEHTRRVALLAARVGEELKLSATARRHLAVGGLLHDIGKLAVPLDILQKPGSLTDDGVRRDQAPPGRRPPPARGARRVPGDRPGPGLRSPRAARRQRLPARADRRPDEHRDPDPRRLRRVRRAGLRPRVSRGLDAGARVRAARGGVRGLRPDRRRRAQARDRDAPPGSPISAPAPPRRRAAPPRTAPLKSSCPGSPGRHKIVSGLPKDGSCWRCAGALCCSGW